MCERSFDATTSSCGRLTVSTLDPIFRPPYAAHNAHVDTVAGDLGYRASSLWSGSLEDHVRIPASEVVEMVNRCCNPQAIVIGHLNHMPVTEVTTTWSSDAGQRHAG
jgi:peptidoglycan/xylan/chitin deacetylase (PgdA/CDA1 family)